MHVEFRYTKDLDVWVRPTRENLERLNVASQAFLGASFDVDEVLGLLNTGRLGFRLCGIEPNMIEVLLRVRGLEFEPAYVNAIKAQVGKATVRVIHPHNQEQTCGGSAKGFAGRANAGQAPRQPRQAPEVNARDSAC